MREWSCWIWGLGNRSWSPNPLRAEGRVGVWPHRFAAPATLPGPSCQSCLRPGRRTRGMCVCVCLCECLCVCGCRLVAGRAAPHPVPFLCCSAACCCALAFAVASPFCCTAADAAVHSPATAREYTVVSGTSAPIPPRMLPALGKSSQFAPFWAARCELTALQDRRFAQNIPILDSWTILVSASDPVVNFNLFI